MTDSRTVVRLPASSLIVGLALLATSCAQGLAFVQDDRVEITAPASHAKVMLPFTVTWTVDRFNVTAPDGRANPDAGYFGVFLDRTPVPPGKPLSWIARDDKACERTPGCPGEQYLADRRVYSTTATTISFEFLPDLKAYQGHERHEVTIVLLDGTGKRIGESAWFVSFRFERKG